MLRVQHQYFSQRQTAEAEIAANELHLTEFQVPAVDGDVHWHNFDAILYLLDGQLNLTDGATGEVHTATSGAKIDLPKGTLHAETSTGYTVLLGSSVPPEAFGDPVDLPPERLLGE